MGVGAAGGHLLLGSLYERTFRAVLRGEAGGALRWPRVPTPQSPFWAPLSGLPFRASPEQPPPPGALPDASHVVNLELEPSGGL